MSMQIDGALSQEYSDQVQISDVEKILLQNSYFLSLLEMLDQLSHSKHHQFQLVHHLRKLIHHIPNFIIHPLRDQIFLGCLKIALQNSQLQQILNYPTFQNEFAQLSPSFLIELQLTLHPIQIMGSNSLSSPYKVLEEIQTAEMMEEKIMKGVKNYLDYSMIFPEAYYSCPYELLYACMCIFASKNSAVQSHLSWFKGPVSTSLNDLKSLIEINLLQDLE